MWPSSSNDKLHQPTEWDLEHWFTHVWIRRWFICYSCSVMNFYTINMIYQHRVTQFVKMSQHSSQYSNMMDVNRSWPVTRLQMQLQLANRVSDWCLLYHNVYILDKMFSCLCQLSDARIVENEHWNDIARFHYTDGPVAFCVSNISKTVIVALQSWFLRSVTHEILEGPF